jgi:hypothetical protein
MTAPDPIYQELRTTLGLDQRAVNAPNEFYGSSSPYPTAAGGSDKRRGLAVGSERISSGITCRDPHLRRRDGLPPTRDLWGINDFVEELNTELVSSNVFLNTGIAKTSQSRFPGSSTKDPYFIVIANSLAAVLSGAESLAKSDYYKDWPADHYAHVVERRARFAKQYGVKPSEVPPSD